MVKERDTKFVEVSRETHRLLGDFGKKNESYGEIVARLLYTVKEYEKMYGKREAGEFNGI